jgi:hypothetical protein
VSPGEMTPRLARSRLRRRAAMPVLAYLRVVGFVRVALLFGCNAGAQFASNRHQRPHWPARAMAFRHDTNAHHRASTRARHDIAGGTCCSAQAGA